MSRLLYGANVQANGIRQHYLRYGGKGQPLLLIPGITSPAITWGFVAERLAEHFDTYVLDARGRGLSSTGPELDYGTDACADDIAAFAQALELKDCLLVGHSMGARFILRAATRHPQAPFSRLALIDPPVSGPGRREYPGKLPWYMDSIAHAAQGMNAAAMLAFAPPGPRNSGPCAPNGCTPATPRRSSRPMRISTKWTSTRTSRATPSPPC